jgi:hypothetical protein
MMPGILHDPSSHDSASSGFTDAAPQLDGAVAKLMGGPCARPTAPFHAGRLADAARDKISAALQHGVDTVHKAVRVLGNIAEQVTNQKRNWQRVTRPNCLIRSFRTSIGRPSSGPVNIPFFGHERCSKQDRICALVSCPKF